MSDISAFRLRLVEIFKYHHRRPGGRVWYTGWKRPNIAERRRPGPVLFLKEIRQQEIALTAILCCQCSQSVKHAVQTRSDTALLEREVLLYFFDLFRRPENLPKRRNNANISGAHAKTAPNVHAEKSTHEHISDRGGQKRTST